MSIKDILRTHRSGRVWKQRALWRKPPKQPKTLNETMPSTTAGTRDLRKRTAVGATLQACNPIPECLHLLRPEWKPTLGSTCRGLWFTSDAPSPCDVKCDGGASRGAPKLGADFADDYYYRNRRHHEAPTVGLEPTTTRLRALRSTD